MARDPAIVTRLFAAASRWPQRFLAGTVAVAVLLAVAVERADGAAKGVLFVVSVALFLGPVGSAVAATGYHPAVLVDRPGERAGVVSPALVLGATGYTVMIAATVTDDIADAWRGDLWAGDLITDAVWTALLAVLWFAALGPFGVRLRPEGLVDRNLFGSLVVPWEALASATAGPRNTVALSYHDPAAVVRRGRRRTGVLSPTTDAAYLADALNSAVTARAARR